VAPAPGERVLAGGGREAREPEVEHLHEPALSQHHVAGLDVAVHDPVLVRLGERLRDLRGDRERRLRLERSLAKAIGERTPAHVLHRDVGLARAVRAGLADVVDHGDVRVRQVRGDARLAQQPRFGLGVAGGTRRETLERHEPVQPRVLRQPDLSHRTRAQALLEPVVAEALCFGHGGLP
jgi:hypothetical protein